MSTSECIVNQVDGRFWTPEAVGSIPTTQTRLPRVNDFGLGLLLYARFHISDEPLLFAVLIGVTVSQLVENHIVSVVSMGSNPICHPDKHCNVRFD